MFQVINNNSGGNLYRNKWLAAAALILITLITRLLFAEQSFYDADTIGFAFGSISYSLENTRPHMPGYFLHVHIIQLLNYVTSNPHVSIIFLSLLYSILGTLLTWLLLSKYFEIKSAFFTTLLIITNPLVWYYGCTTDIYIFDLFFSAALVFLGTSRKWIYYLPVFAAFTMGIRPSSGVFLFPLYFFLWYRHDKEEKILVRRFAVAHIVSIIIFIAWFYPMALTAGSVGKYFMLFNSNSPMPNISIPQNIFQMTSYLFWFFIPLILIVLYIVFAGKLRLSFGCILKFYSNNKLFLWWLLPPIIVFLLFNYAKGWFILIAVPSFIWAALLKQEKILPGAVLVGVIIIQTSVFMFYPKHENKIEGWFNHKHRTENIFTTWYNRTFSVYSMTASKIREQDETLRTLSSLINKAAAGEKDTNKSIFLDPGLYSYARPLQYILPKVKFVTMDFDREDAYIEYSNNNIQKCDGLKSVLINSILITGNNFYENYLSSYAGIVNARESSICAVPITAENIDRLSFIYSEYFIRGQK